MQVANDHSDSVPVIGPPRSLTSSTGGNTRRADISRLWRGRSYLWKIFGSSYRYLLFSSHIFVSR